jgi:hypothetical protein
MLGVDNRPWAVPNSGRCDESKTVCRQLGDRHTHPLARRARTDLTQKFPTIRETAPSHRLHGPTRSQSIVQVRGVGGAIAEDAPSLACARHRRPSRAADHVPPTRGEPGAGLHEALARGALLGCPRALKKRQRLMRGRWSHRGYGRLRRQCHGQCDDPDARTSQAGESHRGAVSSCHRFLQSDSCDYITPASAASGPPCARPAADPRSARRQQAELGGHVKYASE